MKWKKRILSLLCAVLLIIPLTPPSASAADEVIFIALNEQVPKLSANTMPIIYNHFYYVPYIIFDMNYMSANFGISVDLGIRVAASSSTVMLYNKRRQLTYDLEAGTCTDKQGNSYKGAITRGGITYLPITAVQNYFAEDGLKYSLRGTPYGDLLRLTTPSVILDDNIFTDAAASSLLPQMLREYNRSQNPSTSPSPSPSVTPSPSVSPSSPGVEDPDKSGVRVSLAFLCAGGETTAALLDRVERESLAALFLFHPEDLAENEALIRRMVGDGHAVGLAVSGTVDEIEEQLQEGNRLLGLIVHMNTRTTVLENVERGSADLLKEKGWSVWTSNIQVTSSGSASTYSAALLRAIDGKRTSARLLLSDNALTVSTLPALMDGLREEKYSIRLAVGGDVS